MSDEEKLRLFNDFLSANGVAALRGMRIYAGHLSLDAVLVETRIIQDCQDGLRRLADGHGWIRFSFAPSSDLHGGDLVPVGKLWSSLDESLTRRFKTVVWATEALGVEGERELALPLREYAQHKAARTDMGRRTDYCMCHYKGNNEWHPVEARYDKDSDLIQIYLAGWKKQRRVRMHLREHVYTGVPVKFVPACMKLMVGSLYDLTAGL